MPGEAATSRDHSQVLTSEGSRSPETEALHDVHQGEVEIYDVTLRDGEQQPGVSFTLRDKLDIFRSMRDAGIAFVETGMAAASPMELEVARRAVAEAGKTMVSLLCRALEDDVNLAADAGVHGVTIETIANGELSRRVFGWDESEAIGRATRALRRAKSLGVEANLFLVDATRVPATELAALVKKIAEDAEFDRLVIADTFGVADPTAVRRYVEACSSACDAVVGAHFHNDIGLGVANTVEALRGGARHIHVSVNGMGERAGNAATEDVVIVLEQLFAMQTGIDRTRLRPLSALVADRSGFAPATNKSVVGDELFDIESGVATACFDALQADLRWFYAYTPESLRASVRVVMGKGSGAANLRLLARDQGLQFDPANADRALETIKRVAAKAGSAVPQDWARALLASGDWDATNGL